MEELPEELYEFHEVISHMQEEEEAVIDEHRDITEVRHRGNNRPWFLIALMMLLTLKSLVMSIDYIVVP